MSYFSSLATEKAEQNRLDSELKFELNMWLLRFLMVQDALKTIRTWSQCLSTDDAIELYNLVENFAGE